MTIFPDATPRRMPAKRQTRRLKLKPRQRAADVLSRSRGTPGFKSGIIIARALMPQQPEPLNKADAISKALPTVAYQRPVCREPVYEFTPSVARSAGARDPIEDLRNQLVNGGLTRQELPRKPLRGSPNPNRV